MRICHGSQNQSVEKSRIQVLAQLRDLQKECGCTVAISDENSCVAAGSVANLTVDALISIQKNHKVVLALSVYMCVCVLELGMAYDAHSLSHD